MSDPREKRNLVSTGGPRLIQLDLLRGIAVIMVLLNHQPHVTGVKSGHAATLLAPFLSGLWTGVDLFFVLSGYLIGGLLISELRRNGRLDLKRFWIRRGFKIWPSYYLYVAVLAVVSSLYYVNHSIPGSVFQGLLVNSVKLVYLQNYFPTSRLPYTTMSLGNHTWTLAVEEHFYFLLPVVLVVASRFWRVVLPAVAFLLLIGCLAIRLRTYYLPMNWVWDYEVTHKRIDSLFFGVFLSYLMLEYPALIPRIRRLRGVLTIAGISLILPMFLKELDTPFVKTFGYTCLALGYGCLLLVFVTTETGAGWFGRAMTTRAAKVLAWIGFWSYSIYLWHIELTNLASYLASRDPAFNEAWQGNVWSSWLRLPDFWLGVYLVVSIGFGVLLGHLVERPMLSLRDRLYPSRSANVSLKVPEIAAASDLSQAEIGVAAPNR